MTFSEISQLKANWDGEGAKAPAIVAMQNAARIARHTSRRPDAVIACHGGEIDMEWYIGKSRLVCECCTNGDIDVAFFSYKSKHIVTREAQEAIVLIDGFTKPDILLSLMKSLYRIVSGREWGS